MASIREVSWQEAIDHAAAEFKRIQAKYGRESIGAITSSRCTNEETYLIQKLVRAGFGNNNVDTCARVCHSPTGYGLSQTFGTSAGTQDFDSVEHTDVVVLVGANPTDAHPVFASRLKKRLRQGANLIVIDPRAIDLVRTPHVAAAHHLVENVNQEREQYILTHYAGSVANQRVQELRRLKGDWIAPNLWSGLARARPGAGICIVGTPEQCADVLQRYIDIGCHSFCLSGYLHDDEAYRFQRWVRPILADRNARRLAV